MAKDKPVTLEELTEFFRSEIKPEFDKVRKEMNIGFERLEAGQARLEVGQKHLAEEMDGLKADLSDTVTKKDFNKLKKRVERLDERHIN